MVHYYLKPEWFFGMDVFFELAFAIITLVVAMYAFKVYKLSCNKQSKLFGLAFVFFSISYFVQSFLNFIIISKIGENITGIVQLQIINILNSQGIYFQMIFFMVGLVTLTYMTLKIENQKAYFLILLISISSIVLSLNIMYLFYFLSSLLLVFLSINYFSNFMKHKQTKTFLVFLAFMLLLFGHVHFLMSVNHALFYAIGHFFELAAYILILTNLILVLKNGKKTK